MNSDLVTILVWVGYTGCASVVIFLTWRQIRRMSGFVAPAPSVAKPVATYKKKSGLQSDVLKEGTGAGAKNRDTLTVHYTAWTTDGKQVDSSRERGRTLIFKLGVGAVIDGWDQALQGAKEGERRRVTVPPGLAYGSKGTDRVPPNATIIFEVELLKIERV